MSYGKKLYLKIFSIVGSIAPSKEEDWAYRTPKLGIAIPTVSIGDQEGERQHTTYIAAAPEYGRETFLGWEVETVKQLYPNAHYQGLADGASENWTFLNTVTDTQTLEFHHATQYLDKASKAIYPRDEQAQKAWLDTCCQQFWSKINRYGFSL